MTKMLKKRLAVALLLILAGTAAAQDVPSEGKTQIIEWLNAAVQSAPLTGANEPQAAPLSEDEQPAPVAPTASEDVPPLSDDVPPVAPPASDDVQPTPIAPPVSDDMPPVPQVSDDVPPVPPASADVPPVGLKTVDGGYFTVSVPADWTLRRYSDLYTFLSPSGEARLSVAKVTADGRSVHEFASERCAQAGGRDLKEREGGASYDYTGPGGLEQHARVYAVPGKEGTFVVTSSRVGETEMRILDSLQVREEAPPTAVKPPEATPPATAKTPPKRAPRAPKEPVGKFKTLNGSHWTIQVPSSWTLRSSGTKATISAPKGASTIVVGSRLSTHGVPLSEIALAQCRRHNGSDFVRLGRGVCAYTTWDSRGRPTHVRLYPVGASQMVQVQVAGRYSLDVQRALESLYLW